MNKFPFEEFVQLRTKPLPLNNAFLQLIPPGTRGVYLLHSSGIVIYGGRSDSDLRKRLRYHNHRKSATHFTYFPSKCATHTYILERRLYLKYLPGLNRIFPAYPVQKQQTIINTFYPILKLNNHGQQHITNC
jgi:hypothetical protein